MNISINWLNKYIDLEGKEPEEIANKLTMSTVEVEAVRSLGKQLENVFVGKVIRIFPHPNADKLKLVDVELEKEKVKVVCGGTNLELGMLVALAKPGAMIRWHGQGELIKLEPAKVRGEKSYGMICASDEIGLKDVFPTELGEILDLTAEKLKVGQPLAKALDFDDYILDIDNKSITNRPDLWCHYGISRELAALYEKTIKEIKISKTREGKGVDLKLKVNEQKLCPAYFGVALNNIKIEPSPKWLKKALQSVGQKPINNIVDITNYVMLELGQPVHAFDAEKLTNQQIIVRLATPGEKFITLDGEQRVLSEEMLVIADSEKPVALAGVMGGQDSEISNKTTSIIIESANFDPNNIRRTSMKFGLRSEASMRFEKNLDPTKAFKALERVVQLIKEMQPKAKIASELVKFEKYKLDQGPIELPKEFLLKKIGQKIDDKKITDTLEKLGFKVKDKKESWEILVPTWRATGDISIKEDLVEEVSRIFGYDNIKPQMPKIEDQFQEENKQRQLERKVKDFLTLLNGLTEVHNYSFTKPKILEKLAVDYANYWELENPWDENENLMRQNLWPQLVINIQDNLRFFNKINIFELGRVFLAKPGKDVIEPKQDEFLPAQPYYLAGACAAEQDKIPFYTAKAIVEQLLKYLQVEFSLIKPTESQSFQHPLRTAITKVEDKEIGWVSELHPLIAQKIEINQKVGIWQMNFDQLIAIIEPKYLYKPISKYPAVIHDLSLIVDEKVMYKDIIQIVQAVEPNIIQNVELLDVFKNGKIKAGKKSITIRITYQSHEKTLEKEEVEKLQKNVIEQLRKAVGAELRQ